MKREMNHLHPQTNSPDRLTRTALNGTCRNGKLIMRLRAACGLMMLALSASAIAQTHFCIAGEIDAMSAPEVAAFQAKMANVRELVKIHGAPADWHFVVVCDEAGWKDYVSFSGRHAATLEDASYSTDPQLRWTFLRGSDLSTDTESTRATLSLALGSLPRQKNLPQFASTSKTTHTVAGIVTTKRDDSSSYSR